MEITRPLNFTGAAGAEDREEKGGEIGEGVFHLEESESLSDKPFGSQQKEDNHKRPE